MDPSPGDFWNCKVTLTWSLQVKEFLGEHATACAAALDTIRSYTSVTFGCEQPMLSQADKELFYIARNTANASDLISPSGGACVVLPAALFPPDTPPLDRAVPDFNHPLFVTGAYSVQAGLVLGRKPVIGFYRHPRAALGSCATFTPRNVIDTGTLDGGNNPLFDCSRGMFDNVPYGNHQCRLTAYDKRPVSFTPGAAFPLTCGGPDPDPSFLVMSQQSWPAGTDAAFVLKWVAPKDTPRGPAITSPNPPAWPVPMPGVRCHIRGDQDPAYGGLCLRPCGSRFLGDTPFWDISSPGSPLANFSATSTTLFPSGGPLPPYCACLAQERAWVPGWANSSAFPHDLYAAAVAAGVEVVGHGRTAGPGQVVATSLYQHHEFWKPTGGGGVTSEWRMGGRQRGWAVP